MYVRILLFALLTSCLGAISHAQENRREEMMNDINAAIKKGSAREMSKYFGPNADLSLPRAEGTFSKSQSEIILRDFFNRNPPLHFSVVYQGASRDGSFYVIGLLETRDEQLFRAYYLIKSISGSYFLHHVQFDRR